MLKRNLKIGIVLYWFWLGNAAIVYAAGITIPSGSQLLVNTSTLKVPGDVSNAGTLTLTSGAIELTGNWTNSGTFTPGTGTVVFAGGDQTISGSTIFYNFSKTESTNDSTDVTLTFDYTATQTIQGLLTLDGLDDNDRINLRSSSTDNQWGLTATGTFAINYVDVQDSNAGGGDTIDATDGTNIDNGNNTSWVFETLSLTLTNAGDSADYTTWALGSGKELDTVYIMSNSECVLVKNNGAVAEDFSISAVGTNWTLSDATGPDTCVLMGLFNGNSAPVAGNFSTTYDIINASERWATTSGGNGNYEGTNDGDNVAASSGEKLYIYLKTPSSLSQGSEENITVTVGCREH